MIKISVTLHPESHIDSTKDFSLKVTVEGLTGRRTNIVPFVKGNFQSRLHQNTLSKIWVGSGWGDWDGHYNIRKFIPKFLTRRLSPKTEDV